MCAGHLAPKGARLSFEPPVHEHLAPAGGKTATMILREPRSGLNVYRTVHLVSSIKLLQERNVKIDLHSAPKGAWLIYFN